MADLIDRQALDVVAFTDRDGTFSDGIQWLLEYIDALPSVEAEPVRHGHWYKPTGMMPPEYAGAYRCSECDEFAPRDWLHYKQELSNFCPNCGATMAR